ncbi:MAG: HAMP domain-containing histidine kinase [Mariniblastus sp.]|nr:HAMP domain-containing histidine kinase [Mariniblastus sp.]
MSINIALMVVWIILAARQSYWGTLTIGTIAFSLVLIGLSIYLFLTIKERQLSRRQINFVDSVTHELKSPIASLRLYLETLQMRNLTPEKRGEFYQTMDVELKRLDDMINQLLQVARLDAIGKSAELSTVGLELLLESCAKSTSERHRQQYEDVFEMQVDSCEISAPRIMLDMIFGNLFDNAIKYGGRPPRIRVKTVLTRNGRVEIFIADNGAGVPPEIRTSIFKLFFRGEDELQRTTKGTGVGLYVAHTLVHKLRGRVSVEEDPQGSGSTFRIELPCRETSS